MRLRSSYQLVQGFLVIEACCYQGLVNINARKTNLRNLLEGAEMFSADLLLRIVEDTHVLAGLYTITLIHQPGQK